MNAASTDIIQEIDGGSDSETNTDDTPEYYQPISAVDDSDSDSDSSIHSLPNGYYVNVTENGVSRMDLNEEKSGSEDDEEERMREESETAIVRAFREDENRRNAPLSEENATRIMEAMRGVSLGGLAPDWINRVPEHRWMDQLRRIRQTPPPPG
ncbi:clumping factor A isoform X2 [Mangifera indica]|uniref:clumping factor A isoform X2 n=1 Tax=Mangifera indica TaxID=29780 RepID=UPI001CFA3612|nr:clumping factor A isoform X2 [Mangifera indica]